MVYRRTNGFVALSKFIAVCAIAISLQCAAAQDATADATSAVVCTASSGDVAVGIQAIPDSTCASGGLGCFSSACRFCKYSETSMSAHLLACSGFGYNFPTLAPEPATTTTTTAAGDCAASHGDYAVGVRAVADGSCASGGLGCYNDHCRFCKAVLTPQSAHLTDCSAFAAATEPPVAATLAPVGETDAPVADTVAPVVDTVVPAVVDTVAPAVDMEAPVVDTVAPVVDTTAPVVNTLAPVVDTVAPVVDTVAPPVDTIAPAVDTVAPVVDTVAPVTDTVEPVIDTVTPVVDTIAPVVDTVTPVVDTVAPVVDTVAPVVDTVAPIFDTVAPVAHPTAVIPYPEIPAEMTAAPATEEPVFNQTDFCGSQCTIEDAFKALGLDVVKDLTVTSVDPDYYIDGCRFCKRVNSIGFESFTFCALFPSYVDSDVAIIPSTVAPVDDTPAPDVVLDTVAPVVDTLAPAVEIEAPVDASPVCTTPVSLGAAAAGIQIITDATCVNGGLGCIDGLCRFCKVRTTPQSAHLNDCSELLNPSTATPVTPTECTAPLSVGDAAAGIQIITDTDCVYGGLGCFNQMCRFCKVTTTAQSAHLDDCSKYPGATTTEPISNPADVAGTTCSIDDAYKSLGIDVAVDTSVTATDDDYYMDGCRFCKLFDSTESSTFTACTSLAGYGTITTPKCTQVVSPGDAAVGINITTDSSCASGGVGCITNICRFCKVTNTPQSANFANCSTIGTSSTTTSTTSAPAVTTAATAIPLTCTSTISGGDAAVGLDVVTDLSCGDGGVGCISSICRYCKRFVTAQSSTYMNCSDVKVPDTSTITFVPIPAVTTATIDAPVATTTLTSVDAATNTAVVTTTAPATTAPITTATATTAPTTIAPTTTAPVTTAPATTALATTVPATTAPVTTTPVVTTQAPATAAPTTAAPVTTAPATTTCGTVSPGDSAVGLTIIADANCLTFGGLGCIGGTACKFCKLFDTLQSASYAYCPGYPAPVTLSALRVQANADETISSEIKLSAGLHKLFNNSAATVYAVAVAACVGVIAVIAVVAVGAKRVVRRLGRGSSSSASLNDLEGEERSVLTDVTEDSATVTSAGFEEEVGEV